MVRLMQRATMVCTAGTWDTELEVDCVVIDFDNRHRRRILLATESGGEVLLDLPQATRLRDGDGLKIEQGRIVRVVAQVEALLELRAHSTVELMQIAWHLGNRHLPVQILGNRMRIRADHVIGEMVSLLGGHVEAIDAPFDPEAGAYSGSHDRAHTYDD